MWEILIIGAIAAGSVFLGMPLARATGFSPRSRLILTGATLGILGFIAFDLALAASDQLRGTFHSSPAGWPVPILLLAAGAVTGVLLLGAGAMDLERRRRKPVRPLPFPSETPFPPTALVRPPSALGLSGVTAVGIGLHNLAEGMALGTAYAAGLATLTLLLGGAIILHKSTEGYCICGCDPVSARRLSRTQLCVLGLVGGLPVVVGIALGGSLGGTPAVMFLFYGLAIGAIVAVAGLIFSAARERYPQAPLLGWAGAAFAIALAIGSTLAPAGI